MSMMDFSGAFKIEIAVFCCLMYCCKQLSTRAPTCSALFEKKLLYLGNFQQQ